MVFGNGGLSSGAGVAFSRDPSTGAAQPMIDLVLDAQGEDVVSGRRTPDTEETIAPLAADDCGRDRRDVLKRLEREFGDVQDVEFTVEDGKLWILQTRAAKRTPRAALRIAIDLVHEGLISREQALVRIADIDLGCAGRDFAGFRVRSRSSPGSARRAGLRSDAPHSLPQARNALLGRRRPRDPDAPRYQHRPMSPASRSLLAS